MRTGVFWNEVASGFIAGLVARHTLEFERRTRGVLGKDVLTRLRDYVIAHIDEPIEVSTLEYSGGGARSILPGCSPDSLASVRTATSCICDGNKWSSLFVMSDPAWPMSRCAQALPTRPSRVRRVHGVSPTELVARAQRAGIFKISGSLFPKSRSRGAELPRSRRETRKNNMTDLIERRFHRLGTQLSGLLIEA